jgi:hypothetical protein
MNDKLESMSKDVRLSKHNAYTFFKKCKGTIKKEKYVPLVTEEKKRQRVIWCEWIQEKLRDVNIGFAYCFIDEKWFYPSSGRCKEKNIPLASFENDEDAYIPKTGVSSRRNIIKVMFMGIIAPPASFLQRWLGSTRKGWKNGKIGLHRVSEDEYLSRMVRNQKFVPNSPLNVTIKQGAWKELYPNDEKITVGEFLDIIADYFDMEDEVSERLCLSFDTLARVNVVTRHLNREKDSEDELLYGRQIKNEDKTTRPLTINDLKLSVMYQQGDSRAKDCSCDSKFMMKIMPVVGQEIRKYFFWLNSKQPIYLIIDNAGGHGTNVVVEEYR